MAAFSQWSTTCLLLWSALLFSYATAAPAPITEGDLAQSQALEYHNDTGASRCYYNFQHYEEGDRIVTNEPCLNCTCHKRMLMCYLRVCPFTKAVGQDCTVEKKPDQCCPVITCPEVPVDILTSSTTTLATPSSAVGHLSNYGCTLEDNTFYPDGVQMPSDPKKPCELCYCIRNHTACVRQECTLNVEGCRPVYQEGVCCPVRYDCDYNEISTTEQPSTGGLVLGTTPNPLQCRFGDTLYNDGELMVTDKPCESCYCMRGDIVCAVRSCGEPMEGKDCQPLPPPEGECCPTTYQCANETIPIEALVTESSIVMHLDDLQTQGSLANSENDQIAPESTNTELEGSNEEKKEETPVVDQHADVPAEEVAAVEEIEEKPSVDPSEEGSVSNSEVTPSELPEGGAIDQENNVEDATEVKPSMDQTEEGSVLQAEISPSETPEESVKETMEEDKTEEHQIVDQSEEGSVIQAEVSPSEMPEKHIEDKIEDETVVAGESILSDPINADELEEEDILSGHIPTIHEEHSSSDVVTDAPSDSLENLATSAPALSQEEESNHHISSSHPEEPLTEGPLSNSGPSGIEPDSEESGIAPTQSDINVLNESVEEENAIPKHPEIPSSEGTSMIDNNESTPKPLEEELSHKLEASQEHSETDHVQDEHESQSLPSDSDIVTETAQIHLEEAQETSTKSTEQSITENSELLSEGDEQKVTEEAASEANSDDTKVDQPQTHNDDVDSENNLTEQPLDVKPEGETESQGLVEDVSHESTDSEDTNKEPESEPVSSDSTEPAQEENKEPESENEDVKTNEPVEETKQPDTSMANENPVVLEEAISSVPESPESLDQVKESEVSHVKDEIGSNELVSHPEENDKESNSENVQGSHDEVEAETNNSGLPDQTVDESESTDVPTNANTNVEGEVVHKEPIPPRKDDAVPEEHDQPIQHHEGSMTKAEDSIPTDPTLGMVPVETEVPIKTEETENNSELEQSTEPNIKPLDEITEHDVKHDDSEQSGSDVQQESELHESTDVQTESSIASEVPAEPSLLPEVASENTSEVTSEDMDNNNTESPQTVITDQQSPANPDSNSDHIENESISNDSVLEENQDNNEKATENKETDTSNENESVPSVVVTETDVPTNSISKESEVKPEGSDSSVTSEGASIVFGEGDNSQDSQTDKPDQESEETTSQEIHDDHPSSVISSDSDSSSADSTQNISNSEESNEQNKEEHTEGNEVSQVNDKVTNDGTPANIEEETSTDQHNVVELSQTEVNEIPEKTGEDEAQDTEKSTESSEQKFPLSETTETSEPAKDAIEDHADATDNELHAIESTQAPSVNQEPDNNQSEIEQSEDALVNSEDSAKESQTEIPISEDSSANAIHQDDNENKPEEQNNENKPEESSENQTPTVNSEPEKAAEETPDTNEFHEVAHDPVESDPTDFDDQHFEDPYHQDHESPSENEIVDDHLPGHGGSIQPEVPVSVPGPVGIVPGEGDCLVDGQTYTNNSKIPSKSPCHKECICLSSILHCQGIDCPPPPPQLANCMPVHQNDLCCPVYTCDGDTLEGPQAHNHMGVSEEQPVAENHLPEGGDEKVTEIPAHSQDDVSTDLPKNQEQETSQDVTPEQTSDVGEPQPENNVQPEGEATEVVSEAQDTDGAAEETGTPSEEVSSTEAVNPPVPEETNINTGELPNSSSPAHEEEGNLLPSDIVSHEDETKLTDDSSNSFPTESSEKDLSEVNAEQQPLAESGPVETQTNTAETSDVEDTLSVTSVPDSNVHLEDVHKEEDTENQAEILTDQGEIHDESATESSISTDDPLLHKEEQPPIPDDTNVIAETENSQSAVGEDGSTHQPEDGSGENPPAGDSVETENNENDVPVTEVSNESGNPIESDTEVPSINSADNELPPNSENESLLGEENINSKPEDNSPVNNAETSPIEISTAHVSQDESDIPVQSNEESANVDTDLDIKPTLPSDEVHESAQTEGSVVSDDSSSSPLDTNEEHPVTEGQVNQITNEEEHETAVVEELENSNAENQSVEKVTEEESLNEPTEQINSETGEIDETLSNTPIPDSNEPTEKNQEALESHVPETNVDETSSESTSNVETEHHADAIETIHSEEPLPDSEDGVTQGQSTEDTEKTTTASVDKIENNNNNDEMQNEITEPAQQVPVEGQEPGEVETGSESGDLDEISEIQTESSHLGDNIESKPLDEQHTISEVANVENGEVQTPETDDTISHHSAIDSSQFSTENPFGSDHGPSTKEPTTEVEISTKIESDDVNDPNASDDISISTEGYSDVVKGPESDDLTLSAGPNDVVSVDPQNNEGSPETVPSSHESEVSVENEVSSSSSEVGETDHQSPVSVAPDQASQEGESSVSEDNQTVDKLSESANDSEQESAEPEVTNQGEEQQVIEVEHPSQEIAGSSEGQESTELPSISEHEVASQVDVEVSEHEESGQENVPIKEHSPQEDGTPSDIDTSVTDDQGEVHGEEESEHKEPHEESPTQDENVINGIESTSSAEGAVHGEESIVHESDGTSLSAEDAAQINTVDLEQGSDHPESEPPTQESNESIKEEESSVQEQDHSVPESGHTVEEESDQHAQQGHPIEQESDQHIQEPEHHVDQESDLHIQEPEHPVDQESDQHIQEVEHPVDQLPDQHIQEPEHPVDQESDQHIQELEHHVDQESDQHIQEPEHPVDQESDQHIQEPEHPVDQESDQHIQEPEHTVHQESDQHVQEPEHSVDQESDQHIQEPQHSIPDSNLSIQDSGHLVQDSDQIVHETEESIHPLNQPQDSNSVLPPSGETQMNEQDESKPESSKPTDTDLPTEDQFPTGADIDYDVTEDGAFGPGTCRYGGKVYVSAQQIPRDDPCDFCFCFRSDIICLQQSCPPPIHRCHQEPIQGYCCPRYQCPVSMATSLNLTTTTTTTTTTLPPHFFAHAYQGAARHSGCLHRGRAYNVGEEITTASGPCLQCICGADGQMKCDPVVCSPEPMLRKMMEAAISHRRR
ncbi:titin [Homalodisca vitripennis]|nr:titin [Homalodisca vitripennis]